MPEPETERTQAPASKGIRTNVGLVALAVAAVLVGAAFLVGYESGHTAGEEDTQVLSATGAVLPKSPAFSSDELAALPTDGWLTNGGSLSNQRYSPLDEIDDSNVAGLKGVWQADLGGSGVAIKYSGEATPLFYKGVLYTVTGADDVFATDVESGETIWRYSANLDQKISTVCCGWTSRGVGMGEGKIYVGQLDGSLVALDQQTGRKVWTATVGRWQDGETVTSAPLYYNGRVYSGVAGGEYGIRGRLTAYDADTGEEDWRFWTIPDPNSDDPGADTWPKDNEAWKTGGAPVWQTPAVDPESGTLYFSAGNAAPDLNGKGRPGDNLFATSILAIDAESGEYKWHFQEVHHDIWDYDAPSPVVLWDAEVDGEEVKGLSQPGKTGWLYMLDRETGEPIHGITEKPVPQDKAGQATADTQPIPDTPPFVSHDVSDADYQAILAAAKQTLGANVRMNRAKEVFTPFGKKGTVMAPGPQGGDNWPPSSYNQKTQMVYVCGMDSVAGYQSEKLTKRQPETQYLASVFTITGFGTVDGTLTAIDATTGEIAWQKHWPGSSCYSGTTTTAGNLVFVGRNDGTLQAYNAETGDELWNFQTGAGANATPAIFEHDGTEYVAFYAAGNSLAATPHGDNLWLFSLEGTMGPAQAGGTTQAGEHAGEAESPQVEQEQGTVPQASAAPDGASLFSDNCSSCHGATGTGGNGGPDLTTIPSAKDMATVVDQITNGGGGMPPFGGQLSQAEIEALAKFVTQTITN